MPASYHLCDIFVFEKANRRIMNFVTRLTSFLGREMFNFLKYYVELL
jgi:hypothetical protein